MKYHLAKQGNEVVISFEQLEGQAQDVIDAIGRCRASAWACPSAECTKIGDMEACAQGDVLALRLKPRDQADLSVVSLGECLKYHLPKDIGS